MTTPSFSDFHLGVCDYPEHVDASDWVNHAKKQRELGLTWVRLAEFSWAKIEPSDGAFNWAWLDEAIDVYAAQGLSIVLGTPTATPPAWLIQKFPEILPIDENGQTKKFGSRRHYDHASEIYRSECDRIVTIMAKRYGSHPSVKGWQTDNELGHEGTAISYGGASESQFIEWLKQKYTSLDELNEAWGNAFWSQDYTSWDQIKAPNLTAVRQPNPSHSLEYQRFSSDMIIEFQQRQIDVLRLHCPGHFITHNCVIFSATCDLYKLAKPLDFVSWDSYPIGMLEFFAEWESEEVKTEYARTGHPDLVSLNHDIYRGLLNQTSFWVMEQQCGHANWAQYNPLPAKDAVKLWSAQAWAHGASGVIYFRFRASHFAQEIMHSGLLHQNGNPDRGYEEVNEFDPSAFPRNTQSNRVAVLHDYDSLWSYNHQPHNQDLSYWYQFAIFYSVLRELGLSVDIIHPTQLNDKRYDLIISPALTLLTPDTTQAILNAAAYTKIIFGPRTDFRDQFGKAAKHGQFEQLNSIIGGQLLNFDSLRPTLQQTIQDMSDPGCQFEANLWCESYQQTDAKVLYSYLDGPLTGQAAVIQHANAITIGALSKGLIKTIVKEQCEHLCLPVEDLPAGVRVTDCGAHDLVVNFNQQRASWKGMAMQPVSYKLIEKN